MSLLAAARADVRIGWHTNATPAFDFDVPAMRRAVMHLGVTRPVEVGCANYHRGRWGGMHSLERGIHRVRVAYWLPPNDASRTLWHELSHAAQSDRGIPSGTAQLRRELGDDAYTNDPREVEAREAEQLHDTLFPLARPLAH